MATINVDGKQLEVNGADNLLQACLSLGLDIPYFCWHPALGSVGSCRQCAVKQYANADDKRGRLVMSCMTPVADKNTFISIDDAEATAFRASVVEWLMTNHPHDCPVCEEGGHCHLQDMTVMTGHDRRRYRFTKRTHHNQELGPFIAHEMNRCIACYRCVRFYKDYAGGTDLGVYGSAARVYFGRETDGVLESEFAGNLVEVCPTGVFTDKTHSARYNRKWDMQYAPSICQQCSVGCNTSPGERYGELRRIENRFNGDVNHYFLCDRGRFGYGYVNRTDRPRRAMLQQGAQRQELTVDAALDLSIEQLKGKKILGIGSPRASLETNFALRELVGAAQFSTGLPKHEQDLIRLSADILQTDGIFTPSLRDIESYDAVLILGEDITQTAPRIALAVRQAAKSEALKMAAARKTQAWLAEPVQRIAQHAHSPIYIIAGVATRLSDIATTEVVASPNDIARFGFAVAGAVAGQSDAGRDLSEEAGELVQTIAKHLVGAVKPLIIAGTGLQDATILHAAAEIVHQLSSAREAVFIQKTAQTKLAIAKAEAENIRITAAFEAQKTTSPETAHNEQAAKDAAPAVGAPPKKDDKPALVKVPELPKTPMVAGLTLVLPEVNSMGMAFLDGLNLQEVLAADYDALVIAENDVFKRLPAAHVQQLLNKAKTVLVLDHQQTPTADKARIVLPAASFAEGDGTVVSNEGRAQRYFQVYAPEYYDPTITIKESWRWLHVIRQGLQGRPPEWLVLDDVIEAIGARIPQLAKIIDAAPHAGYRVQGLKIAREPRRYSGRTSMRAQLAVSEPRAPQDKDSALTFSMEGYVGPQEDGSLIPFAWAAGWNSPQAWNKFQDEVGGHLKAGDPGVRLFDILPKRPIQHYAAPATEQSAQTLTADNHRLLPIYSIFGSDELSARSPVIQERMKAAQQLPSLWVSSDSMAALGFNDGQMVQLEQNGFQLNMPVKQVDDLPFGMVGYPVAQAPVLDVQAPISLRIVAPMQPAGGV